MLAAPALTPGFIRSLRFDSVFILGCALLALFSGMTVTAYPTLFSTILMYDVQLLGMQHVIATYTRLCFDKNSFKQNRFLVLVLPWFVVAGVGVALVVGNGPIFVTTLYLYWQWFHYTRQSYGVHRIYARKVPSGSPWDDKLTAWALYSVPLWGILYRSYQKQLHPVETFLGFDFRALPVPEWLVMVSELAAHLLCAAWALRQMALFRQGKLSASHTFYVISHMVIFVTGYCLIDDITVGWLVLNIWHNSQYILIVWMFNNNRFKRGIDPNAKFLSFISQRQFVVIYFAFCTTITLIFYSALSKFNNLLLPPLLPGLGLNHLGAAAAVLTYQAVNFHHYIVDGIIWKVRQKANQQGLGLTQTPPSDASSPPGTLGTGFSRDGIDAELEAVV